MLRYASRKLPSFAILHERRRLTPEPHRIDSGHLVELCLSCAVVKFFHREIFLLACCGQFGEGKNRNEIEIQARHTRDFGSTVEQR